MFAARNMMFANAVADPLAGLSFLIRLQTHNGDNVPLGLYQDAACTTPATADNDPVEGWKDELSGSGLIAVGTGTLKFVSGSPVVRTNGTTDYFTATVPTVTSTILAHYMVHSRSVIASGPIPASLDDDINDSYAGTGLALVGRDAVGNFGSYRANTDLGGPAFLSGKHVQVNTWDGTNFRCFVDGVGAGTRPQAFNFGFTKIRISGGYYSGALQALAAQDVSALLIRTTTADRATIEAYLATL